MSRPLRHFPMVNRPFIIEATCRTVQGRKLLKPSKRVTAIIFGIIGRALAMYKGIKLVDFTVLSNHYHLLLIAESEEELARFMGFINGLLARKVAGKVYGWKSKTWGDRYHAIPIIGEQAMVKRLKYIYSQGMKHDLVEHPCLWPGATSVRARLHGEKLEGKWYNQTAIYNLRRRGHEVDPEDHVTLYEIELAPLPCWVHLSEEAYRERIEGLVMEAVMEAQERWELDGTRPMGAKAVLDANPTERPPLLSRSPAPQCHASSKEQRKRYRKAVKRFYREEYYPASERLRAGEEGVVFPPNCFPPAGPFVRPGVSKSEWRPKPSPVCSPPV